MDETVLALMVIYQPFENLSHWERAITVAVKHEPAKLLIADRCGITISRTKLTQYYQERRQSIKNPRHAEYWQSHEYPVMLVVRTSERQIR